MSEAGKPEPQPASVPRAASVSSQMTLDDFQRLTLRIGTVVAAQNHPNADRLLILSVDLGEETPRQVVAGIRGSYEATQLVGRQVVVVANMKPAMLRGVESQGMILAASQGSEIVLVGPDRPIAAGSTVK